MDGRPRHHLDLDGRAVGRLTQTHAIASVAVALSCWVERGSIGVAAIAGFGTFVVLFISLFTRGATIAGIFGATVALCVAALFLARSSPPIVATLCVAGAAAVAWSGYRMPLRVALTSGPRDDRRSDATTKEPHDR